MSKALDDIYGQMSHFRTWAGSGSSLADDSFKTCVLLCCYPRLEGLLTPYLTARFRRQWESVYKREISGIFLDQTAGHGPQFQRVKEPVVKSMASFLRKNGEGAMVVVALLNTGLGLWTKNLYTKYNVVPQESKDYRSMHMLEIPAIEGKDPLEILLLIEKLNEALMEIIPAAGAHFAPLYEYRRNSYGEGIIKKWIDNNFYLRVEQITPRELFKAHDLEPNKYERREHGYVRRMSYELACEKEGVADWLLSEVNRVPDAWFEPDTVRLWRGLDECTRAYLIVRACDILWHGERVAKYSYPQPTIPGVGSEQVGQLVLKLMAIAGEERNTRIRKEEEKEGARLLSYVRKSTAETDADLEEAVKELRPQVLTQDELERVKEACATEIAGSADASKMMRVVSSFVELCDLLAWPENRIMVQAARGGCRAQ